MRSWKPSAAAWMTCLTISCSTMLAGASSASGQPAAASSTRPAPATGAGTADDACALLREAYRLRLIDLAQARRDSAVAVAQERARGDSLAVELRWTSWRLEAAREDRPAWWEDARVSFLAGALTMALAFAAAGRID